MNINLKKQDKYIETIEHELLFLNERIKLIEEYIKKFDKQQVIDNIKTTRMLFGKQLNAMLEYKKYLKERIKIEKLC